MEKVINNEGKIGKKLLSFLDMLKVTSKNKKLIFINSVQVRVNGGTENIVKFKESSPNVYLGIDEIRHINKVY